MPRRMLGCPTASHSRTPDGTSERLARLAFVVRDYSQHRLFLSRPPCSRRGRGRFRLQVRTRRAAGGRRIRTPGPKLGEAGADAIEYAIGFGVFLLFGEFEPAQVIGHELARRSLCRAAQTRSISRSIP